MRLRTALARGVSALVAVVFCLILLYRLDLGLALAALAGADRGLILGAVGLNLVFFGARGYRWWTLGRGGAIHLSLAQATRVSSLGVFMSSVYPGLGEATRLLLLRRQAVPVAVAASVIASERLVDTVTLGLLLLVGVGASPSLVPRDFGRVESVALIATAIVMAVGAGWLVAGLARRRWLASGAFPPPIAWLATTVADTLAALRALGGEFRRRPRLAGGVVLATLLAQLLAVATGWATLLAFGLPVAPVTALLLVVLVNLGLGLAPSPLGLGLYQAAGLAVLAGGVVSAEVAVAAGTGLQVVNYGATILVALVSVAYEARTLPAGRSRLADRVGHLDG